MLHIHRSHRTAALVEGLAELLAEPLADPMQAERLLVGSRGMERWLAAELAERSEAGVFANVTVDFPAAFVDRLTDDVLGQRPRGVVVDPWSTDALVWTLAGRLPDAISAAPRAFAAIARYLEVEPRDTPEPVDDAGQLALLVDTEAAARGKVVDRKLLGFAGGTADLFDRYGLYRPDMVRAWRSGQDTDASGGDLGELRWQAELWRAIAAEQEGATSPASRIAAAVRELSRGHALGDDVPARLVAFGVSTLPPLQLELLAAVATQRDVHLFVPSPSPALWRLGWDGDDDGDAQPANALLRAAGPVGRHAATLIRDATATAGAEVAGHAPGEELPTAAPDPDRATLLARLQHDIATDTPLPDRTDEWLAADAGDRSIVFHDGHGAVRQVEALQDELLRRFDADPTLHPRDVVVLTPDIGTYAPLVQAVFADPLGRRIDGRSHDGEPPTIPVAVADRTAGRGNPVAAVLRRLLALVHARTSGAEVLDLLSTEPVRARFRLTPSELVTVQRWVEDTGVAWARDEQDRAAHDQPARRQHTWAAAVDRLLVGVAMADEAARTVGGVVPYDAIEDSADLALLDRLTRFLEVVDDLVELRDPRFPRAWAADLGDFLDRLTGPADGLPWQDDRDRNDHRRHRDRVDRVLSGLALADETVARPIEVRALARWLDRALERAGSAAGHGTGAVTVAELVPLRAIPFRVVCLLGMDTGVFPRSQTPPGHDLVARDPRPGDRDRRAEDRALFLDAVHAAQDALVVCYAGRDPVSGQRQPPAIPVAELRDAVAAYVGRDGLAQRTVVHPVLPTGAAAFAAAGPVSFDRVRLAAAEASLRPQDDAPPFIDGALGDAEVRELGEVEHAEDVIELDQFARVLAKPAQALLQRLRIARPEDLRTFPETEPLDLDALERWKLGTQLLDAVEDATTREVDFDDLVEVALARGRVPAGGIGRHEIRTVRSVVDTIATCLARLGERTDREVAADVGGTRIQGKVRVAANGRTQVVETWYGQADGKRHLRAWLRHLVASIDMADQRPRTVILRREGKADVEASVYRPVDPDEARRQLARWLATYHDCRRSRVPFVAEVSWTYATARREAERLAATAGVDLADVEGLTDDELKERHGDVADGRRTVAGILDSGLHDAHGDWGRGENDRYPAREDDAVRLVFRDVHRWEHLVARTDFLELARDLLRPLADATERGAPEAAEVAP